MIIVPVPTGGGGDMPGGPAVCLFMCVLAIPGAFIAFVAGLFFDIISTNTVIGAFLIWWFFWISAAVVAFAYEAYRVWRGK
jgi:hypothetical protein